jgi:hypothetical protein
VLAYHRSTYRAGIALFGWLALAANVLAADSGPASPANTAQLARPIAEGQRVFTCGHSFHV